MTRWLASTRSERLAPGIIFSVTTAGHTNSPKKAGDSFEFRHSTELLAIGTITSVSSTYIQVMLAKAKKLVTMRLVQPGEGGADGAGLYTDDWRVTDID